MPNSKLVKQWEEASNDLGIDIATPYEVRLARGDKVEAKVFVKNFGHDRGTLVFTETEAVWPHRNELLELGYGYSVLEEPTTAADELYNRESFIDMLSEWEWTGADADKPDWLRPPSGDD